MSDDDALIRALHALGGVEPDAGFAAAVRARAHRALAPRFELAEAARRGWSRVVAPALLTGGVAAYLAWAFQVAASAYGG